MCRISLRVLPLAAVLLPSIQAFAQDVDVTTFTPPEIGIARSLDYPDAPLARGEEGAESEPEEAAVKILDVLAGKARNH